MSASLRILPAGFRWRQRDPGTRHCYLVEDGEAQLVGGVSWIVPRILSPEARPGWGWSFIDPLVARGAPASSERFAYLDEAEAAFEQAFRGWIEKCAAEEMS